MFGGEAAGSAANYTSANFRNSAWTGHLGYYEPDPDDAANDLHATSFRGHQHHITTQTVEIDGDTAHAESYILGVLTRKGDGEVSDIAGGRYLDRLERRDGEWRIRARRGIGEGSEVVGKEMSEFADRDGKILALRPEGTASHADCADPPPVRSAGRRPCRPQSPGASWMPAAAAGDPRARLELLDDAVERGQPVGDQVRPVGDREPALGPVPEPVMMLVPADAPAVDEALRERLADADDAVGGLRPVDRRGRGAFEHLDAGDVGRVEVGHAVRRVRLGRRAGRGVRETTTTRNHRVRVDDARDDWHVG